MEKLWIIPKNDALPLGSIGGADRPLVVPPPSTAFPSLLEKTVVLSK